MIQTITDDKITMKRADIISVLHVFLRQFYNEDIIRSIATAVALTMNPIAVEIESLNIIKIILPEDRILTQDELSYRFNMVLKNILCPYIEAMDAKMKSDGIAPYAHYLYDDFYRSAMYNILLLGNNTAIINL